MKGMNARRFTLSILATLAAFLVLTAIGLSSHPALAQSPTPTVYPTLTSTDWPQDHEYMSGQIAQGAEFSIYNYENTLLALEQISSLQQQISNVTMLVSSLPDTRTTYYRTLSDGHEYKVEKSFSYSEAAIILMLIGLIIVQCVALAFHVARRS